MQQGIQKQGTVQVPGVQGDVVIMAKIQDKIEKWMKAQEEKLKAEEGRLNRYPRTVIMLFLLAISAALFIATVVNAFAPQKQVEPAPKMTIFGFLEFLKTVEMPAIGWVFLFAFLWLTKWR